MKTEFLLKQGFSHGFRLINVRSSCILLPHPLNSGRSQSMNQHDPNVISYLGLRKAVGIIGCALPFLLIIGRWFTKGFGFEPTISDYYYTNMGDVFVGCMCAIGIFLMSVRGFDLRDKTAGHVACIFAIMVAFFPT